MPKKNVEEAVTSATALIQDFMFGAPLYAEYNLAAIDQGGFLMFNQPLVVDGHCPFCQQSSTFRRTKGQVEILQLDAFLGHGIAVWAFDLTCARNLEHVINFILRVGDNHIQKIGQFPSLADIANDESRLYRQVLDPIDSAELHRAIGLAAHGVGVGSFVYLRRVFERLVTRRFNEFKAKEGWTDGDFVGKRMGEKIELLERHLPSFLVRNKKVYAILSKGIHELQDAECLNGFEMLKHAIFFILDEDKHKKQELELRRKAEQAIASFSADGSEEK